MTPILDSTPQSDEHRIEHNPYQRGEFPAFADEACPAKVEPEKHLRRKSLKSQRMCRGTVMMTDMADSSLFAERFGSRAAYQKRKRHNSLLRPLIKRYHGQFVEAVGDSLLVIFDRARDAIRCSVAIQGQLRKYNRSAEVEKPEFEIHVRIGLHTGEFFLNEEHGRLEVAGRAVNVAARVESANKKATDQVLVSEACWKDAATANGCIEYSSTTTLQAKGIGSIQVYQLDWKARLRQKAISAKLANLRRTQSNQSARSTRPVLSARSGDLPKTPSTHRRCCAIVVDSDNSGHAVPIRVSIRHDAKTGVYARSQCGRIMRASAERAVKAAFDSLQNVGFGEISLDDYRVEWWMNGPDADYDGASLGVAITLATVSAYTGAAIPTRIAVTGAVDGKRIVPISSIGQKWRVIRQLGQFGEFLVPARNARELATMTREGDPKVIPFTSVADAIRHVFGAALGLVKQESRI